MKSLLQTFSPAKRKHIELFLELSKSRNLDVTLDETRGCLVLKDETGGEILTRPLSDFDG